MSFGMTASLSPNCLPSRTPVFGVAIDSNKNHNIFLTSNAQLYNMVCVQHPYEALLENTFARVSQLRTRR